MFSIAVLALALLGLVLLIGLTAAIVAGQRRHFFIPLIGVTRTWGWVLALPWLLLAASTVAAVLVLRGRPAAGERAPRMLRWSTMAGVALALVLWMYNVIA